METALFENKIVSIPGFIRARTSESDSSFCPVCDEKLTLSSLRSVKKTASFNHFPKGAGTEPCPLSYPNHPNYSWLTDVDLDEVERAQALKSAFFQVDNLKRAFVFLTRVTGKGAVSGDVFELLLRKANQFNIWRYAGLPLWAVPYLLLTFTDFYVRRPGKKTYVIRLVIEKPSQSQLNTTWLRPEQCRLVKYFVNKGKASQIFDADFSRIPSGSATGRATSVKNPLPFSADEFKSLTSDTSWVSGGLEILLRRIAAASNVADVTAPSNESLAAIGPVIAGTRNAGGFPDATVNRGEQTIVYASPLQVAPFQNTYKTSASRPEIVDATVAASTAASVIPSRISRARASKSEDAHNTKQGALGALVAGIRSSGIRTGAGSADSVQLDAGHRSEGTQQPIKPTHLVLGTNVPVESEPSSIQPTPLSSAKISGPGRHSVRAAAPSAFASSESRPPTRISAATASQSTTFGRIWTWIKSL